MTTPIHVAITRRVKHGCEKEFESSIQTFFKDSFIATGSLGAQLIKSLPGSSDQTYGILRSFASEQDRDQFYQSHHFLEWEKTVEQLVEPDYTRNDLHGLEAFFVNPSATRHPPKWKMAIVTWLGVWPTVFIISMFTSPYLQGLPAWLATGFATLLVVLALTWMVMPLLIKIFQPWLLKQNTGG